ncbi:14813_t:CDS:2 [Funneliformis geosporum]|uniref:14813_t:CDS:1 n=1 Tax=Funneliformis geosporum TaxID=1117311 RepID=A0A9W4SL76_9GLOM|nr:14813_t:CDS:2 [Funneliformis geosporum]
MALLRRHYHPAREISTNRISRPFERPIWSIEVISIEEHFSYNKSFIVLKLENYAT